MRPFYVIRDKDTSDLYPLRGDWVSMNDMSHNRPFQPFYSEKEAIKVANRIKKSHMVRTNIEVVKMEMREV